MTVKSFITLGLEVTNTLAYQGVQCCSKKFYNIRLRSNKHTLAYQGVQCCSKTFYNIKLRSDKHASLSRCFNAAV